MKALQLSVSTARSLAQLLGRQLFRHQRIASKRAYPEAASPTRASRSTHRGARLLLRTELVTMEDLYVSPEGGAIRTCSTASICDAKSPARSTAA